MMKNIQVLTTFHKPGLDLYGQNFITSFEQKVDKRIKLLVYAEDCEPVITAPNQVTVYDAKKELPKLVAFKDKWKDDPKANGKCPPEIKKRRPRDWHKEFKWDAIRFANKVYAVFDACEKSTDWCVWMDADTLVHTDWSYDDFSKLLPDDQWITYVGRGADAQTWPECGFYGLNLKTKSCQKFLAEFERFYEDADNGIFKLIEWHDSFVFGHILDRMKAKHPNFLDYSAHLNVPGAKTGGGGHPLINTELGRWIDHMKGTRKNEGKSRTKDLVIKRNEGYWQ